MRPWTTASDSVVLPTCARSDGTASGALCGLTAITMAAAAAGSSVYRVVIGPLKRAESGTLLLWFGYGGYPDAFLKQE